MNIIVEGLMAIFVLCFCILCLNRMNIINAPHLIVSYYIASHRIASIKCLTTRAVGRSENPWGWRLFWRRRLCFYYCKNLEGQEEQNTVMWAQQQAKFLATATLHEATLSATVKKHEETVRYLASSHASEKWFLLDTSNLISNFILPSVEYFSS